ncbi:uncharacterized protein CC84DRAFT_1262412 [Paraphaeosphaeria sporulosa]|uniref:C2H2-type domain-containing protein n=1 Tax=Paraphaeosphaeria sporulosa TaxID=1460663 RepID=A0A177C0X6_9PLEO|nr:uncharacterized protein CC84DRAFT_1262412 [Paraphaeosphaeria sporulosa]OAG01293.1 hypothetical protein CC84DRAFT_1262412 [Paraphaeosphaeria sporulosa]
MEDQYLDSLLDGLGTTQLQYLRQRIDERLGRHDFAGSTEDQVPFVTERGTYYSTASTLYPSGRSTPIACSITSDWKSNFAHHDIPDHNLSHTIDPSPWHSHTVADDRTHLRTCVGQETPHKPLNEVKVAESTSKKFFCTFCFELGSWKDFGTKHDWKRHEEDYHDGTGLQWLCQVVGCSQMFSRGIDFRNHLKKGHEGKMYPRDCKEVRQITRMYACGFDNCRALITTWKHHCDHVATHMAEGDTTWTYDRTIRNLLKHRNLAAQWKQTYGTMCPQLRIVQQDLSWDIQATRSLRDQLETHSFHVHLEEFLLDLFSRGLPPARTDALVDHTLASGLTSSSLYTGPPSIPPILPSSMDFGLDPSFESYGVSQPGTTHPSNDISVLALNNRNSVVMADAPPFDGSGTFSTPPHDPFEEVPLMATELISLGGFITETSPTYDTCSTGAQEHANIQDIPKSHSPRALVTKSREWLASKKSQHFQHGVIDHPDVSPSMRLPRSPSRKRSMTTVHRVRGGQS